MFQIEAVVRRCSVKKSLLRHFAKFTGKHPRQSLFFNKVAGLSPATLLKKETVAQVFFLEHLSYRTTPVAASVQSF